MMAELGLFSLILAFVFSLLLAFIPALGVLAKKPEWQATGNWYANGQFFCLLLAYSCLVWCFLTDDFSLLYVLSNSSVHLPWFYKFCAVWGGHEGSMLLWVVILSTWTIAVGYFSKPLSLIMRARVLSVLGAVSAGLILFLLATSNPFVRQFQLLNTLGRDLNPLLQDPGFLFHPPMLYMGYVGFSVAFAFAIAALWAGEVEASWAKWTRPWTLAAWCCLTSGITLGSWWAYRELGWGGWWFWDPVENASFMPWLSGTALLHSLAVSDQRQQFKVWTLLLAISTFSLSLVGTFIVRSGVLTSVHAFAVDPKRGLYILVFLFIVIGGALALFSCRAQVVQSRHRAHILSRESSLLLNNLFLVVALLTVLMGTLYPLLIDGLGLGKLSVGAPYFNTVFVPLILPLLALMGIGVHVRWQQDSLTRLFTLLYPIGLISLFLGSSLLFIYASIPPSVYLGFSLALWIIISTFFLLLKRGRARRWQLSLAFYGMVIAHLGVAVTVIGISVSTGYGQQEDVKIRPGESTFLAGYHVTFVQELPLNGPNYHGARAVFIVEKGSHKKRIYPEKRIYDVGKMAMTESAIDVNPFRDIYVALGEPLEKDAWSVRLYYKPLVRWIWAGGGLMFLGGMLALLDRRYYLRYRVNPSLIEAKR